jgi:hypothetical protein
LARERKKNGGNDEFYTPRNVSGECVEYTLGLIDLDKVDVFVEPSAGDGSFLDALDGFDVVAYDINPKDDRIIMANWFDVTVPPNSCVIGNPPYGFASNDAVKFFNHAATAATVIAFMVPKTFRKISIHNKLDRFFHKIGELDYSDCQFEISDGVKEVPSVFQVWERRDTPRKIIKVAVDNNPFLEFTTKDRGEFSIRRVGGRSGKVLPGTDYSESSTYFCREKISGVKKVIDRLDFSDIVQNTVGVRSLSKAELLLKLYLHYGENDD